MNKQRPRGCTECPTLSPNLPEDLIPLILLRLPVRSLLRFKSVCKSWLSLISDPQFAKSHFDLAAAPTHRYKVRTIGFSIIGFQDIDESESLHDESALVKLKCPLPLFPDENNTSWYTHRDNDRELLGSCRGFVLVVYDRGNTIIWNPSTGVHRRIPGKDHLGQDTYDYLTGFGYDKSTDDYLLVLITPIHLDPLFSDIVEDFRDSDYFIECFSLRKNSWSGIDGFNVRYAYIDSHSRIGSLLNEALHWLVISFDDTKHQVIIALDLVERSLSEIPISHDLARQLNHKQYYLRVMGEYLSLCYPGNMDSMAEIWMMKKYKVQSSWTKVFAFSTCNIPRNVFFPIRMTRYGEIFGSNAHGRYMILNDKGWLLDLYTSCGEPIGEYAEAGCGVYRESLLSFPNDFEEASEDDQLMSASEEASEDDQ